MLSLGIFIAWFVLTVFLTGWALSLAARAVGSSRGRAGVGIFAYLLILVVSLSFAILVGQLPLQAIPQTALALILLVAQLAVIFCVLMLVFRLSLGRTFAPFGVYVALGLAQFALALFIVKPFIAQAFVFPTKSMTPTIEPDDRFLVSKILHPRRWDLIAYRSEGPQSPIYCKRLIGLPGERLRFDHGTIFINDQEVAVPPVLAGRCHASTAIDDRYDSSRYKDGETIVIGGNEYFFIGDNVDASVDSRQHGPFDRSSLVGVVDLFYWPPSKFRIAR